MHQHRNPWKTLSSRIAYENAWVRVREDQVLRPDSQPGIYGVIEIRPSIGVVAVNERDEVALVGQWRYTVGRYSWEIPRGGSSPGEMDMLDVARRELREEVGVEARCWNPLGTGDVCNGVTTDVQHFFIATELTHVGAENDPVEDIDVQWRPFHRVVEMVMSGEITEVCTIAAVLKAERLRSGK